jgi:hypothetical protein
MGRITDLSPPPYRPQGVDVDIVAGFGGALSMLAGLYWALLKGHIVIGANHREIVAIKDQQIADKDSQVVMWRAVGETSQAQTVELLEHARLSTQLLTAIEARAKANQGKS